jgi:hypothetical protein
MSRGALDGGWEDGNDEMSFEPFQLKHLGEECVRSNGTWSRRRKRRRKRILAQSVA